MNISLTFSDAAKYADIARNLISGEGYGSNFNFWGSNIFDLLKGNIFPYPWTPPVMPFSVALFYKIFGINDFAVVATSFFFFILTLLFVFLLCKKIFNSKLVGILSTLAVGFNYDLVDYATKGASEAPFIFEIVAGCYFVSLKKRWANVVSILLLVLMYFTRPHAFIYIAGIILFSLLINFKIKKAVIYFVLLMVVGLFFDYLILRQLSGQFFLYSIFDRVMGSSFNQSSTASDVLRGAMPTEVNGIFQTIRNIFYNLYNFYKATPDIFNPYLFGLFALGFFIKSKTREVSPFKLSGLFMFLMTLLVAAASIPFYRYIHPVIPIVYVIAVGTLIEIINLQFTKQSITIVVSSFLILFFAVGQTLGIFILDSRFERNIRNIEKPPVYIGLSTILKENTNPDDVVVTNLDTWGSWYGQRKTVWFPLEPKQIIDPVTGKIPFDAIYLTSYRIDDSNYYMGDAWRQIYNNPNDPTKWVCEECIKIGKEFKLKGIYNIPANSNYEKMDANVVLLIRK